ncbi:hypothetical protein A1O3_01694 [Capronia epimyces CBS 606.96]|uniref:Uncharacterized protein n=1 Tax=Capronia epimyces CBS 606.96 TaxID=1182542 RepID=W9YJQ4_9EURO|nr:uncharacterized protein A1O3_01694 [Capronia epimyces CBS 606.96]EXJ93137.1 hypothetical protein A1O3_01694 [Capronia epimyces CBS 606.96]
MVSQEGLSSVKLDMLSQEGLSSIKLDMSYDKLRLSDDELLQVMLTTHALGMTTLVHAENHDV